MAKIIGRTGSVGIAIETTRGTTVAPAYFVPFTSLDFDDKVSYIDNDSAMGRIEEKNDSVVDHEWAEGSYEGKIFTDSVGVELVALFGQAPSTAERGTSDVFDHTFSVANNNQHTSLTVAYKDANQDLRYALAMINTWSLEVELENFVRRSVSLLSKKSASASNTVAHTNENEFIAKDVTFKLATALSGLDAASATKIRTVNLEVNKNAEALYVLGSQEPDDIVNKQFAVTGSFEAYMDSTTLRALALGGSLRALRFDIVNSDVDLGSTHNPALRFDIAKAKLEFERGFDNNEIMMQTISFEALYSIGDTSMITARLTNAHDGSDYATS